jgi:hypothetical protein
MATSTSDLQSLTTRLEKLEKQNRLFRRGGLALLLSASTLVVMGQAQPSRTIEAHDFILKDANGNKRAELELLNDNPMLALFNTKGEAAVRVSAGGYAFYGATGVMTLNANSLSFQDHEGHYVLLSNGSDGYLTLSSLKQGTEGTISLVRNPDRLSLNVIDSQGFKTVVGNVGLEMPVTGESRVTSAASIRMFNQKGNVIWAAPSQ